MTVKIYTLSSNASCRNALAYVQENGIDYVEHRMNNQNPLSWDQFSEILMGTENGVEDIISKLSNPYKELTKAGVDFDELSMRELHEYVVAYPKIVKSPLIVGKGVTLVGYNDEEMSMLLDRKRRKKEYGVIYNMLKLNDLKYGFSCENEFDAVGV